MAEQIDTTMELDGALVQHGKNSDRIYLMDLLSSDPKLLIPKLVALAKKEDYGKIFTKIPRSSSMPFLNAGFQVEATAQKMFQGEEDGLFLGYFLKPERYVEPLEPEYEQIRKLAQETEKATGKGKEAIRLCTKDDAPSMAKLYDTVFDSYPFPINDPAFIASSMDEGTVYAGIEVDGTLVALASGECSFQKGKRFSEMTDFATLPEKRGNGFALSLLAFLEEELKMRGILTAYTIARAISPGMNITFAKAGYSYGGRLHNNTNIAGTIESMNVWYKMLT